MRGQAIRDGIGVYRGEPANDSCLAISDSGSSVRQSLADLNLDAGSNCLGALVAVSGLRGGLIRVHGRGPRQFLQVVSQFLTKFEAAPGQFFNFESKGVELRPGICLPGPACQGTTAGAP